MLLWVVAGILLTTAYPTSAKDKPCPSNLVPCFCEEYMGEKNLYCENVRSIKQFDHVLKQTRGLNLTFTFRRSKMGDIPSDFFQGHQSTEVHFDECDIKSFGSRPFSGLEDSLIKLYIYDSVQDMETLPLSHLKKLEMFAFSGNFDIKRLGNDWFEGGPTTIRHISVESNDFEEIGDKAFTSLINVEQIWMGENKYDKVSRAMFPRPANKLDHIEMSFNRLTSLPDDLFEDMPVLKNINVSGNKLKTISEAVFGKIWGQLVDLYFQRNEGFICDEKLKWITTKKMPNIRGTCGGFNKLRGKNLKDLKAEDFE